MLDKEFRQDKQGKRFADVLKIPGFDLALAFFDNRDRQRRMMESEQHHDRPALAGVVKELEQDEKIKKLYEGLSAKEAIRFRQAVGVIVRLVMVQNGWKQTGLRGSLAGISDWFKRPERYWRRTAIYGTTRPPSHGQ
jgi:hypothetical protein